MAKALKIDWNGHIPDVNAMRAAKEIIKTLPPFLAGKNGAGRFEGHDFHIQDGVLFYDGESENKPAKEK